MVDKDCDSIRSIEIGDDVASVTKQVAKYRCRWHNGYYFEHNGTLVSEVIFIDTPGLYDSDGDDE